jgi:hypothetical protein
VIVSLTPLSDFAPVPRVEIRLTEEVFSWDGGDAGADGPDLLDGGGASSGGGGFDAGTASTVVVDVPAGTDRVTFWRSTEGRPLKVRGGVQRAFSGSAGLLDLEAGFDVPSSYEVECFSGSVSLGRLPLGSVVLPWTGDPDACLVQQPLNPRLNAVVVNLEGSWPAISRSAPGERVYTQGSSYPSVVGFGPRQGITDAAVDFGASTRDVASRVWATLGTQEAPQLPIWLIRTHQGLLPRVFFGMVDTLQEIDVDLWNGGWSRFSSQLTEVAPPAPALVESPLRYSDLAAVFPTYSALKAALPRYSQVTTAFEYAGAAGG